MKLFGRLVYRYRLSKLPNIISYEKLSSRYTWKLQQQGYCHNLTLVKFVKIFIRLKIISQIKGWWFKQHYYRENGKIFNSLTSKYYYVHDEHGLYKVLGKPCCKKCKKVENTYPDYVMKGK